VAAAEHAVSTPRGPSSTSLTLLVATAGPAASKPHRGPDDSEPEPRAPLFTGPHWTLFFDGSSRKQEAGAGVSLLSPHGDRFKYMVYLDFKAALLFGLSTALWLGV
jgi:hypothetical protein